MGGGPVHYAPAHRARTPGRPVRAMLATPHDVTNFTPRLSSRAEQYEGMRLVFRSCPGSSSGSAFPIESGSDFAIGIKSEIPAGRKDAVLISRPLAAAVDAFDPFGLECKQGARV